MRKTKLSAEDVAICKNLRRAREILGLTQSEVARQLGLERATLQNYERCRTPIRFEIALRFCRQFIVSEEWLATGRCDMCRAQAVKIGIAPNASSPGMDRMDEKIFFHQCLDLWSEPASRHIPTGTLFSEAWENVLSREYDRLVAQFFHYPRIWFTDADNDALATNFLTAINNRFMWMLTDKANRARVSAPSVWRAYTLRMMQSANLIWRSMMGFKMLPEDIQDLAWLRDILSNPGKQHDFLGELKTAGRKRAAELAGRN